MSDSEKELKRQLVIKGTGIGRGAAIAPLRSRALHVCRQADGGESAERILCKGTEIALEEIGHLREKAIRSVGEEHGEVYDIYAGILSGTEYQEEIKRRIRLGEKLPDVVEGVAEALACRVSESDDRATRAMAAHLRRASELLKDSVAEALRLCDEEEGSESLDEGLGEGCILVVRAAETDRSSVSARTLVDRDEVGYISGIVCVGGTENSGYASYARLKGIPAIVISEEEGGLEEYEGEGAIIDATRGRLTINPELAALDRFSENVREAEESERRLSEQIGLPSVTRKGRHVELLATIERGEDVSEALAADAEGIGLLKTEYIFEDDPDADEEKQYGEYRKALERARGRRVTLRSFAADRELILADRRGNACGDSSEMGMRGVRVCLAYRSFFKRQLRAMLRAAAHGELSLAIPFAVSGEELRRVSAIMIETVGELCSEGRSFCDRIKLGVIVDTPAAAISIDTLAQEADFFLVDGDLLLQFTLAADLREPSVAELIKKNPEPTLRLIEQVARGVHEAGRGKRVGVMGAIATDTSLTERLIAAGVDFLSVPPPCVLELRRCIRESSE